MAKLPNIKVAPLRLEERLVVAIERIADTMMARVSEERELIKRLREETPEALKVKE